jgi:UDP-2,3-diacylglucosamine pyrophosphatase LpxH
MKQWRTIIMSDLHLGSRQSQTEKILKFLNENESDTLILNGDIIDGWALKNGGKWKSNCSKIFRKFMKRSENGTKVVYIRGNHDDFLKPFIPFNLNNIQILRKYKLIFNRLSRINNYNLEYDPQKGYSLFKIK